MAITDCRIWLPILMVQALVDVPVGTAKPACLIRAAMMQTSSQVGVAGLICVGDKRSHSRQAT